MGLGNTFEQIAENLVNQRKQYEEKCLKEKIEKPFIVYQNSIGNERFASLKNVKKYLEKVIPSDFSVSCHNGKEEDDEGYEETSYEIEVTVKLKKES